MDDRQYQTQPSQPQPPVDGAAPVPPGISGVAAARGPRPAPMPMHAPGQQPDPALAQAQAEAVAASAAQPVPQQSPHDEAAAAFMAAASQATAARVHAADHGTRLHSRRPLAIKLAVIGLLGAAGIGAAAYALHRSAPTAQVIPPVVTTDDIAGDPAAIDASLKTTDTNLTNAGRGLDDEPKVISE